MIYNNQIILFKYTNEILFNIFRLIIELLIKKVA